MPTALSKLLTHMVCASVLSSSVTRSSHASQTLWSDDVWIFSNTSKDTQGLSGREEILAIIRSAVLSAVTGSGDRQANKTAPRHRHVLYRDGIFVTNFHTQQWATLCHFESFTTHRLRLSFLATSFVSGIWSCLCDWCSVMEILAVMSCVWNIVYGLGPCICRQCQIHLYAMHCRDLTDPSCVCVHAMTAASITIAVANAACTGYILLAVTDNRC